MSTVDISTHFAISLDLFGHLFPTFGNFTFALGRIVIHVEFITTISMVSKLIKDARNNQHGYLEVYDTDNIG